MPQSRSDDEVKKRLYVHAMASATAMFLIAIVYPLGPPVDETMQLGFSVPYLWVAAQSVVLSLTIGVIGIIGIRWLPLAAYRLTNVGLFLLPLICLLDCITFHWVGERLLSPVTSRIMFSLLPGLLPFLGAGSIATGVGLILAITGLIWCTALISRLVSRRWSIDRRGDLTPLLLSLLTMAAFFLVSTPAWWSYSSTFVSMGNQSNRHPWCMFRLIGFRGVGVRQLTGKAAVRARLEGLQLFDSVEQHVKKFNAVSLDDASRKNLDERRDAGTESPDIVIFVIESLRHEAVTDESMPHLTTFMKQGRRLKQHFSGGNSTNRGMFSLVNGTDAVWFDHAPRFAPMMNRLFHQAGFELGFFGSTDDWKVFKLDSFINEEHYDRIEIEPTKWLEADRLTVDRAKAFLNEPKVNRRPRLAVVYLFSSHAPFRFFEDHEVFTPASSEWFVMPYSESMRPPIWNRYLNSLHSLDHLLEPLLDRDRIVIAVGDHGESFLEDGTIGHGGRLAKVQNMTPAFLYFPDRQLPEISALTSHADVLPTMLDYLDLRTKSADTFDGMSLFSDARSTLQNRTIASMHYLGPEVLLAGPWTLDSARPFGYRVAFSTSDWQVAPLNPISDEGLSWQGPPNDGSIDETAAMQAVYHSWLTTLFGTDVSSDPRPDIKLFEASMNHPDWRARAHAIRIATDVEAPSEEWIRQVSRATADTNAEVRQLARDAVIEMQRRKE